MANLLVSDDDPQVLDLVTLVLEDAGHTVVATGDARAVCSLAAQPDIDAIVLDVNMPKSGFEILNELRDDPSTSSLPILFLSGLGGREYRARGLVEGADDYMVKPFEPAELVLRVERLLSFRPRAQQDEGIDPEEHYELTAGDDGKTRFGRYEVLDVIGQGSMGTVYRGLDPRLQRRVALKTIRLETMTSDEQRREMLDRLRNEAITIARFNHPNIVVVYDMGGTEKSAFIAMELVDGPSLRDVLRQGPLGFDRVVPMAAAVASGLAIAHAREVIHRDVKPGNVLLGNDGAVKVSDFGLAFALSTLADDQSGISGTPGHVPPEVMSGQPYSAAGDLFGLGATLYESLTGTHPLTGATLRETISNTLRSKVVPLQKILPDAPGELVREVMALLSIDPEERPTAADLAQRLDRLASDRGLRWSADFLP